MDIRIGALKAAYKEGSLCPAEVITEIYSRIRGNAQQPVWIHLVPEPEALHRAASLGHPDSPLWGIPFAVKDNIDVAGIPTTAACPEFAYTPRQNATVVEKLLQAGAILIGKTNMDQFATGLVGVRSPHGACSSVFDERYISGGSSSGSAVAVAMHFVSFALGTDTAGSGRVPAAFNDLVGLKPTRGLISTSGVLPACRTLDCVSVFAGSCEDAAAVLQVAQGFDATDAYSRTNEECRLHAGSSFRFGVPRPEQLRFFGDQQAAALYEQALVRLEQIGGTRVPIDFRPFAGAAALLYNGPWVAERLAAIEEFAQAHPESLDPVVGGIITGAQRFSAVDTFRAQYTLQQFRRSTEEQWSTMDMLVLPTCGTIYTLDEVANNPIELNTNLGYYTNFVNLLDLAALAVPAGFRRDGLPFGVSFIAHAFTDPALLAFGSAFTRNAAANDDSGFVPLAVVGAHLSGEPLNHQLVSRGAKRLRTCRTAPEYRLFALRNTAPPKPGLIREPGFQGPGIEVEVWAMPTSKLGTFIAGVPSPLGIGKCLLEDGTEVVSFICEPYAAADAMEITGFGGWRAYRRSLLPDGAILPTAARDTH